MPGPLYSYVASASQFCRFTVEMEVVVVVVVVVYGMLVWGVEEEERSRGWYRWSAREGNCCDGGRDVEEGAGE